MRDQQLRMALILGLLSAVGPFAIDMYLPALPQVAEDLQVTEQQATLTLTAYFITFGIAQMIWGPMSDAVGRKPPILIGVSIFLLASIAATFAPTLDWLVAARALQAFGAATLMVVPRAVIRDLSSGPDAARMMAAIMIVISVSPMLAPLAGSGIMLFGNWREIFAALAIASLISLALTVFALPETLRPEARNPVSIPPMLSGITRLLTSRRFMGLTFIGGFGMASFFVFLASASFVYTRQFGLSPTGFSLAFAFNAIGFFSASQFAAKLGQRLGMERLIAIAITGFVAATATLTLVVWLGLDQLWVVIAGLFIGNAFLGLVMPTSMVMALDPHPDIAGLASSLGGTIQMLTGGAMIVAAGAFLDNTALPMVAAIACCAALAWLSAFLSLPRLRF
ncbi:multidrug effflux MFS transporter [Paracoccus sulfuroxidans]|uniref:Bcr/CflA family efflux transporter n=1 Tax=Paracoccus sulfuroxidans TaxID=384678 RepID=A0A562P0P6_9RHOB|nr:multidrug effflux MFS transporter [Paracoccus sulfuroxidans]TWI38037.1 DHA1 family bicyclomycin/chloramphenicol resistance-like MFS transporter [Paracoccus sulfuroxidans]